MCPGLLCCALAVTPTLQHGLKTELSTPKTLQHLQPHPLVLPFACEKPGKEVSPFPAANLSVGSCTPGTLFSACMKIYECQLMLWAGREHRSQSMTQKEGTLSEGTCRVLLTLEWLCKGAQEEMLSLGPVPPGPKSLRGQQGSGRAAAGQWQSCSRAAPGQPQPWGSDLGCGRVPPLAAASSVTEPARGVAVPHPQTAAWGAARCRGRAAAPGAQGVQGEENGPALLRGWGTGLLACAEQQVHVCTAAKAQLGNFCTFTAQYLGLHKSKNVVVH